MNNESSYNYNNTPNKITDNIYIGDLCDSADLKKLKRYGITHVLICGDDDELQMHFPNEFIYHHIYLEDIESSNIRKHFDENYTFLKNAIENNGIVLIHW